MYRIGQPCYCTTTRTCVVTQGITGWLSGCQDSASLTRCDFSQTPNEIAGGCSVGLTLLLLCYCGNVSPGYSIVGNAKQGLFLAGHCATCLLTLGSLGGDVVWSWWLQLWVAGGGGAVAVGWLGSWMSPLVLLSFFWQSPRPKA
jgi:hypothetical protein